MPFKGVMHVKPGFQKELMAIMPLVSGIRRFGSAALDLAYTAAGRYDGYWEAGLGQYDVAAGVLLVREAGGFVSPFVAKQNPIASGDLIATNSAIHDEMVRLLRAA
jgi:myo-inositol-1(or 4)-monophosphatase